MKNSASAATTRSFDGEPFLKVPDAFICPITLEVMKFPLMTRTGLNFDCDAILHWIKTNGSCPLTRKPMRPSDLISNRKLHQDITRWRIQSGLIEENDNTEDDEDTSESSSLVADFFMIQVTHEQQQKIGSNRSPFSMHHHTTEHYVSNDPSHQARRQESPRRATIFGKRKGDSQRTKRGVLRKALAAALQLIEK
jgi:hypothetical protein